MGVVGDRDLGIREIPEVVAASAYGVAALPQTFFLDARHRIVDRVFGAVTQADLNRGIALATGS